MKVLIAFEFSGRMRRAFEARGHDVISCDLLPSEDNAENHVIGDVLPLLRESWDLVIAHPPCTRLANSGVRWLHERGLWEELREAADVFLAALNANAPRIAVENPVMHKYARDLIGRGPNFTVQPWMFGDNFKKRTCFWTKGLPPLVATSDLDGSTAIAECHLESPGKDRWKNRSRSYNGLCLAAAEQWG